MQCFWFFNSKSEEGWGGFVMWTFLLPRLYHTVEFIILSECHCLKQPYLSVCFQTDCKNFDGIFIIWKFHLEFKYFIFSGDIDCSFTDILSFSLPYLLDNLAWTYILDDSALMLFFRFHAFGEAFQENCKGNIRIKLDSIKKERVP